MMQIVHAILWTAKDNSDILLCRPELPPPICRNRCCRINRHMPGWSDAGLFTAEAATKAPGGFRANRTGVPVAIHSAHHDERSLS